MLRLSEETLTRLREMQAASEESEKAKVRAGLAGDRENRELGREWAATSATWNELFR